MPADAAVPVPADCAVGHTGGCAIADGAVIVGWLMEGGAAGVVTVLSPADTVVGVDTAGWKLLLPLFVVVLVVVVVCYHLNCEVPLLDWARLSAVCLSLHTHNHTFTYTHYHLYLLL